MLVRGKGALQLMKTRVAAVIGESKPGNKALAAVAAAVGMANQHTRSVGESSSVGSPAVLSSRREEVWVGTVGTEELL